MTKRKSAPKPPKRVRIGFTPHGYAYVFAVGDDGLTDVLPHDRAEVLLFDHVYELVQPKKASKP